MVCTKEQGNLSFQESEAPVGKSQRGMCVEGVSFSFVVCTMEQRNLSFHKKCPDITRQS